MTRRWAPTLVSALAALALTAVLATSASADVPSRVHYQGFLTDSADEPIHCASGTDCPAGPVDLTFRLYPTATSQEPTWEETHSSVPVVHGVFEVVLGQTTPFDPALLAGAETFLGISVNGGAELQPRQQLIASPFALWAARAGLALVAEDAQLLGGQSPDVYVRVEQIPELCVTDEELALILASSQFMTAVDVGIFLNEQGYVTGPHLTEDDIFNILAAYGFEPGPYFSGWFDDLQGVPEDLADGDDVLDEAAVDAMVANNGFAPDTAPPPVGSIVAFHPHLTDPPLPIPAGWAPCDGSAITDPKAYEDGGIGAGLTVGTLFAPDLNSAVGDGLQGRFLRGGATSGVTEADFFAAHVHASGALVNSTDGDHAHAAGGLATTSDGDHTHGAGDLTTGSAGHDHGTAAASNPFNVAYNTLGDGDDKWALQPGSITVSGLKLTAEGNQHTHAVLGNTGSAGAHSHTVTGTSASAGAHSHTISGDTASTGGVETRPANFSVVWILRVY